MLIKGDEYPKINVIILLVEMPWTLLVFQQRMNQTTIYNYLDHVTHDNNCNRVVTLYINHDGMVAISLVPRPHSLTGEKGLVHVERFLDVILLSWHIM